MNRKKCDSIQPTAALVASLLVCCAATATATATATAATPTTANAGVAVAAKNAVQLATDGVSFSHKDWELACDNTRTCRAVGYHSDADQDNPLALLIERPAGVVSVVRTRLMLGYYGEGEAPPFPSSLEMLINARSVGKLVLEKSSGIAELNAAQATALLLVLPKVADVQFVSGSRRWKLSGSGAAAVLLKMDEAQGRLATTSAFVKKGQASDNGIAAALPIPVVQMGAINSQKPIDKRLAAAIRPLLAPGKDDCLELKQSSEKTPATELLQMQRMNVSQVLVSATCWSAAYNSGSGYWLVNDTAPYQPRLITDSGSDYSSGTISAHHKGRGMGDCWSSQEWVWNGTDFTQSSASSTGMCKLVTPGGAWGLPTVVSRVVAVAK